MDTPNNKVKRFGVLWWRISYSVLFIGVVAYFLIPGIAIINQFERNVANVKSSKGKVYFKRTVNKVNRIGIIKPDGTRILFHCNAGFFRGRYLCLRDYRWYSAAKQVEGKEAIVEWYEQDIPLHPGSTNMLLSMIIDGNVHLAREKALKYYKDDVKGITKYIVSAFAFVLFIAFIFELFLKKLTIEPDKKVFRVDAYRDSKHE